MAASLTNTTIIFEGFCDPNGPPSENLTLTKQQRYGYFPATLNQSLAHGRYTILRKLGWGTASSVWLAKDNQFVPFSAFAKSI
jgi:serine/threonine-protein kinase SRPK3